MKHDILVGHGGIQSEILQRNNLYQVIQAVTFLSPIWRSPTTIERVTFSLTIPKKVAKNHVVLKTRENLFDLISHEAHKQLHVESTSTLRDDFGSSKPSSKKGNNLDLEGFLSNPQNPTFGIKFLAYFQNFEIKIPLKHTWTKRNFFSTPTSLSAPCPGR